ncbi:DNA-binding protein HU [Seminavis robusta]|uniref:DNA-binding protein HU n=1 Tax=Seminavis robusta TaxID=568900 RepID=A0A9N8ENC5_9STRA|nr:DNA-binding protein HU [Seminavis robusta]|eukprot:Sro1221_g253640.1 DNA-binding protein HU (197) ;mRNA; r:7587-8374
MSFNRLFVLGVSLFLLGISLVSARRHSSAAFISSSPPVCTRKNAKDCPLVVVEPAKTAARGPRGVKGVVSLKAAAASGAGAKKKKKAKKKSAKTGTADPVENVKKAELVASIAEKTEFTKAESEMALTAVLETFAEQMALGKKITLMGFGTFQAKERAARKGRNPRTGEEIDIPAAKAPTFSASKALKNLVNGIED